MRKKIKPIKPGKLLILAYVIIPIFLIGYLFIHKPPFCANSISCIKDLTGRYDNSEKVAFFMNKRMTVPSELAYNPFNKVLGENTINDDKRIFVDLSSQTLYAYNGTNLVYSFPVSSGKWSETPTGDFRIWIKLRFTKMEGGNKDIGTYYNLPNVPYTMFFYNETVPKTMGYGLHGAYWHNNFGHPMSHGCVNLKPEDAEKLFYWADPQNSGWPTGSTNDRGTLITIAGQTPEE